MLCHPGTNVRRLLRDPATAGTDFEVPRLGILERRRLALEGLDLGRFIPLIGFVDTQSDRRGSIERGADF
jgi:hypothetical protein